MRLLPLLLLLALPARAQDDVDRGVVLVLCIKSGDLFGTGTGFVVNAAGAVVTNEHVTNPEGKGRCDELKIAWLDGGNAQKADTRLLAADARLDLAVLQADQAPPPLKLFGGTIARDLDLRVIGFPGAASIVGARIEDHLNPTLTRGGVSRLLTDDKGRKLVQTDAAISSGNSGGPLLDTCHRVLGVATFVPSVQLKAATGAEGIGWAVHVAEVIAFLTQHSVPFEAVTEPCVAAGAAPAEPGQPSVTTPGPSQDSPPQASLIWIVGGALVALGGVAFLLLRARRPAAALPAPTAPAPTGATLHLAGRTWPLGAHTTIGRDPDICDVLLPPDTDGVSRRHLEVRMGAAGIEVRDCWSSGGTRLGGQPLKPGQWYPWTRGSALNLGPGTDAHLG